MNTSASRPQTTLEPTLVIERTFDFPRTAVYDAWTERDILSRWFAPTGCSLRIERLDVREGGGFHMCIRNPIVGDCWTVGTYVELTRPDRIVFTFAVADAAGNRASSVSQGHDAQWPEETVVTVTFTERNGQTMVRLEQSVSEALAKKTGAYPSWLDMLDRLKQEVGSAPQATTGASA